MPKPVSEWTEDDVLALPSGESDRFERKGVRLLDLTRPEVTQDKVMDGLAPQLSAFANTGGGQIIYGVSDAGGVEDGGIPLIVKGRQSTKDWLEDIIPNLTDPEILGFNVYEIRGKASESSIAADRALYVVDIPDSERAPHQSRRDDKYYVRLGSKSRPASHRLIEDIRNRTRHPKVEIHNPKIFHAVYTLKEESDEDDLELWLEVGVKNSGVLGIHNALMFDGNLPMTAGVMGPEVRLRTSAIPSTILLELIGPLHSSMDLKINFGLRVPAALQPVIPGFHLTIGGRPPIGARLAITSFADSAPANRQEFTFREIDPDRVMDRAADTAYRNWRNRRMTQ